MQSDLCLKQIQYTIVLIFLIEKMIVIQLKENLISFFHKYKITVYYNIIVYIIVYKIIATGRLFEFRTSINDKALSTTTNRAAFKSRSVNSELNGKDSMSFLGPKIWELIPKNLREIENLKKFKSKYLYHVVQIPVFLKMRKKILKTINHVLTLRQTETRT